MRRVAALILIASGVGHGVYYALLPGAPPALLVFGAIYLAIGIALEVGRGRAGPWLGLLLPAFGGLGGLASLQAGFDAVMAAFVVADAAVVVICAGLLLSGAGVREPSDADAPGSRPDR